MHKIVFFDINETILDLGLLKNQFDKHFKDGHVLKYWFSKLLHSSTVMGIMDCYKSFGELADAALESVFYENNKPLTAELKSEILGAFKSLPAYKDVVPALNLLKNNGFVLVAISNSSNSMIKEQLTNANIIHLFDAYYSVDSVKKYKPFKNIYLKVAENLNVKPKEIVMVATHDWDLFGAKQVDITTAYVERKQTIYHPFYAPADITDHDLISLAQQIVTIKCN